MTPESQLAPALQQCQRYALAIAGVGAIACGFGFWIAPDRFFQSYLVAFLYFWTASMGCLGLALINQMTGGRWGWATRPFFEAGARTLPLLAIVFVPLGFGLQELYVWTNPDMFEGDPHAAARQWYLSEDFFLMRSAVYLLLAAVLGVGASRRWDLKEKPEIRRWPTLAGLTTVVAVLTVTLAMTDWGMSLNPNWYSTMYGAIFIAGGLLVAMCLAAAGVALVVQHCLSCNPPTANVLNDLGNLILAFLMVWGYLALSQFLIIYAGNLPIEVVWYLPRTTGEWAWVAIALIVLHFACPFLLLLSRDFKRHPMRLAIVALALAGVHWLEVYWVVMPTFYPTGISMHWLDLVIPLTLGSLLLCEAIRNLKPRLLTVLPIWPHLSEGAAHG